MMHLTEDQLYHLAELSCDAEELNTEEDQQFDHVKSCRECFNQYCVLATILDATSLNCDLVFDPVQIPESTVAPVRKLLVALRVTCERVYNTISLIGEQIPQNMATFAFEPVLATAVRGSSSSKTSILRMEDLDDEDTYFVYDAENRKLIVQFDANGRDAANFKAYLKFADQITMDIPLLKGGLYLKGTLSDVPSGNFDIFIEEN